VIWSLIIVVAFKYVFWVLKADNEGEGGVFALFALLRQHKNKIVLSVSALLIIAAGLLFGDGIITPAISVLSAVEGLKVITPTLNPYVVPITIAILTGLFAIQSRGTHKIGKLFGPVILVWFFALAALGLREIISSPAILEAFNPLHAARAFTLFPAEKLLILLGSVMLVVTGGEALYADMGHFGALPIRLSWFTIVMPCLILNYLGQGAYLLQGKEVISDNLFYSLVPSSLLAPMVILASMATVIASQALISGAFSLTSQGIALGLLPRLKISHTHEHHEGQIYISFVNWSLFVGCVLLVIGFGSSAALASAYGLAVSGVMVVTTLSMILIAQKLWNWSKIASLALFVPLLAFDSIFLTANSLKFLEGGYVPLTIGLVLFVVMSTWRWGRRYWSKTLMSHSTMTMGQILKLKQKQKHAFERSLLVLSNESVVKLTDKAPPLLELFIKRYASLPDHVISLTIKQVKRPFVDLADRYDIKEFENDHKKGSSLLSITANFGFLEQPDVEKVIADIANNKDLTPNDDMKNWIIYVARERFIGRHHGGIKKLRSIIYTALVNNASPAYDYYGLGEDSRLNAELVPVTFE
jgi:KUP system potassium uptake protein